MGPALQHYTASLAAYKEIVQACTNAGLETQLMVSDTPGSFVTYADSPTGFHAAVSELFNDIPGAAFGCVYDIEGQQSDVKLWQQVYKSMTAFDVAAKSKFGQRWTGFTFWGPYVAYQHGIPIFSHVRHIEWGSYFSGDAANVESSLAKVVEMYEPSGPQPRVSIGVQVSEEDGKCTDYSACNVSMVWGKGMQGHKSLPEWVDAVLYPAVAAANLTARLDPKLPFYVESLPAMMAFSANAANGKLPCTSCSVANGDVSWCT